MDEEVSTEKTAATDGGDTGRGPTTTRRTLLIAGTAAATAAVAGCSGISDQSFESSPVTLSTESQDQLRLEEMEARSETITQEGPAGEIEVTITSHAAVYSRAEWLKDGGETTGEG